MGTNWEKRDRKMKKRNDLKEMNSLGLWEDRKQQQERDKEKSKRKKMYKKLECIKSSNDFNLVVRDTSTSVQRSMLECKKCNRTIGF